MTIAIGFKAHGNTWIAADTREVAGNSYRSATKIVKFNDAYVAVAGWSETQYIIEEFVNEPEAKLVEFNTISDIRNFARTVFKRLRKAIDHSPKEADEGNDELLIVTANAIYTIDRFLYAVEHKEFAAIGSGAQYGMAAMDIYCNEMTLDQEEILKKALTLTCKYVLNCGKPFNIYQVGGV